MKSIFVFLCIALNTQCVEPVTVSTVLSCAQKQRCWSFVRNVSASVALSILFKGDFNSLKFEFDVTNGIKTTLEQKPTVHLASSFGLFCIAAIVSVAAEYMRYCAERKFHFLPESLKREYALTNVCLYPSNNFNANANII